MKLWILVLAPWVVVGCGGAPKPEPAPAPVATVTPTTPAPAPAAPRSQIEATVFAPALAVHLEAMTRRPSGLYVQDLVVGDGPLASPRRSAVVRYSGWLPDGTLFDGGRADSEITVALGAGKTIRGWEEGLIGMRVGGKRRLVIPPSLGYGTRGSGPIPPNSVLVFEMELVSIL